MKKRRGRAETRYRKRRNRGPRREEGKMKKKVVGEGRKRGEQKEGHAAIAVTIYFALRNRGFMKAAEIGDKRDNS